MSSDNLVKVKTAMGLIQSAAFALENIEPETAEQYEKYDAAIEYLASFQRQQLFNLLKAFE